MRTTDIRYASTSGQALLMLMAALRVIKDGPGPVDYTKRSVLELIKCLGWFDIQPEDRLPYPSQPSEPRWKTLLAWARKNGSDGGLVRSVVRDEWIGSKEGFNVFPEAKQLFQSGEWDVTKCYLWTSQLKWLFDPKFDASHPCHGRPPYIYEDRVPPWITSVRSANNGTAYTLEQLL